MGDRSQVLSLERVPSKNGDVPSVIALALSTKSSTAGLHHFFILVRSSVIR